MSEATVYLDCAASAPLREEALAAERAYDASDFAGANPNSLHTPGRLAARALDGARQDIAHALGARFRPQGVVFTSGGTESDNLALIGLSEAVRARDGRRKTVIMSAIEHDAVLACERALKERGFDVEKLAPRSDGAVRAEDLASRIDGSCALVSVMAANNETGAIQPVPALADAAHAAGALFHTDAVQAFCRVAIDYSGCDAVSVSAHKLGGPVGAGALVLQGRIGPKAQLLGGGQEGGRRSGTQDVRGALAFAAVARACSERMGAAAERTGALADALMGRLVAAIPGIALAQNSPYGRLPGTLCLLVPGADSQELVLRLDELGFAVSAGSACSAHEAAPSHVLLAQGMSAKEAQTMLRVSFDERASEQDLGRFADALASLVSK